MSDYEALVEVIRDEIEYLKTKRDEAKAEYRETKHDPDATDKDKAEARIELRLARARWFAVEVLADNLEKKVRCKVNGIDYM